jgi:hypothetical protein
MHLLKITNHISGLLPKEQAMRKSSICFGLAIPMLGAPPALSLPRLTDTALDYFLMPLLGYLTIIVTAQLLALVRRQRAGAKA